MTRFDVAVLSFRILALYLWLETAIQFSSVAAILLSGAQLGQPDMQWPILGWSLTLVLSAGFGCLIFFMAHAIARRMFPGSEPMSTANRPEIGALALKVCGLLLFANSLSHVSQLFDPLWSSSAARVVATALTVAAAACLFFAAPWLSRRMFGAPVKPLAAPLIAHVQAVTYSVVGIWLLATALPALFESMSERVQFGGWGRGAWTQIALAGLGLLLFVGGTGLSAFWHWMRHAGLEARERHP